MEIRKKEFLILCDGVSDLNHSAGRYNKLKDKAKKKTVTMKFYDRTSFKLEKFAKDNNLTKNQVMEALIELLPYIELM